MEWDEFIRHWNYFCSITKQLEDTSEYVDHGLNNANEIEHGNVYSNVFKQIILLSGAEFETMAKALCKLSGVELKEKANIADISIAILEKYPSIVDTKIYTKYLFDKPFKAWHIKHDSKMESKVEGIEWWKSYTEIKHDQNDSYKLCTLETALAITGALYVIDLYVMKVAGGSLRTAMDFPAPYFKCEYTANYYVTNEGELPGLKRE